ncbi:type I-E CRISPR-associated protein Cse1/CasA [Nocardiopsis synnemataformans]|uniref:type I-E CRISPR-associated protein Cse1/CasA n=1 Tax=Nocardiopsis synnemataformans TaxID=61305 RepID=UPI003EB72860
MSSDTPTMRLGRGSGATPGLNLFTDPWIPVIYLDGSHGEVGVRDALTDAARICTVAAEDPTVDVALHRLLLAVAHRLAGEVAPQAWPALWESGLPLEGLEEVGAGRWELLPADGSPGFAQDPVERPEAAPVASLTMWAERGSAAGFFGRIPESLTPAEAARWLLWCQSYDTAGIRAAHGKGRDAGVPVGPAAAAPYTRLIGQSLAQTLMLNLAPGARGPAGTGWWERTEPVVGRRRGRTPDGMVDLLCWPSRRIRLLVDADGLVRGVFVTGGDDLKAPADPGHGADQSYQDAYKRVLPRSLETTIPGLTAPTKRRTAAPVTPEAITWFSDRHHLLDQVRVETTTMATDKYRSTIQDTHARTWDLPAAALVPGTDAHARLVQVRNMLRLADHAVRTAAAATVPARSSHAPEQAEDLADRARHQWSGDLTPELAHLDSAAGVAQAREALVAVVDQHIGLASQRLRGNPARLAAGTSSLAQARQLRDQLARYGVDSQAEETAGIGR